MNKTLYRLISASLFAALAYVATVFIRFPSPIGYINLGDCVVLLGSFILGPVYGALAGGIGSMLADLFGFPLYAGATLIIKSAMAFVAALIAGKASGSVLKRIIAAAAAEIIMVSGYFIYECFIYDPAAALGAVPFNLVQGIAGIVSSVAIFEALKRTKALDIIKK